MKKPILALNKIFDHRVRLGIMSALMVNQWLSFNDLKELLDLTDGNLASHLRQLEEEGMVKFKKQFQHRKPKTIYRISEKGKEAFKRHLDALEEIIRTSK